jgi:hypothetical protein
VGPGKRKTREGDEALLAVLRETGFVKKEVDWLAVHGVHRVEDVESLREKDLANLGVRFRKLIEYVKSCRAQAQILQKMGCEALLNLAGNADNKVKVAAEGGIGAILGAMRGHPESEEVQAKGCGALWSLAVNANN